MRLALLLASLLLASLAPVACSDDGGNGGSAVRKCEAYIDRACDYAARCEVLDKASCVSESSAEIDCSRAVEVTASYDECLEALDAASCPASGQPFSVPAVCQGTVRVNSNGGSGGSGGGVNVDPEATTKCQQFTQVLCTYADGCQLQSEASCLAEAAQELPCDQAVQVSSTYDQCLAGVKTLACPAAGSPPALPGSCNGIILFPQSSPPPGGQWQSVGASAVSAGLSVE